MENSIYLEVLLHVMQMTLLDNISPDDPELSQALAILRDETNDLCSLCQIIERGIHTSLDFPPGYLLKMFGPWRIAIPWPLVESFPDDVILADLCAFATSAKVGVDSSICLSGTSARIGHIPEIGDVDFAEYVFDPGPQFIAPYIQVLKGGTSNCLPVAAKLFPPTDGDKVSIECPWPDLDDHITPSHKIFLNGICSGKSKIDFIGFTDSYGYIPVTNMIFPTMASPYKTGIARGSFSFQEAVLLTSEVTTGRVWPLLDVVEMIDYFHFLLKDAAKYARERPLKAAKRASALVKFLYLHEHDESFVHMLKSNFARTDALESRIAEIERMVSRLTNSNGARDKILADLNRINNPNVRLEREELRTSGTPDYCRRLVETAISDIMSRLHNFDPRLEQHFSHGLSG
jgi:hypothetical protein